MTTIRIESAGPADTDALGQALGACARPGDCVGLLGDLGAGKTLLVQGVARGAAVPPSLRVTSPTFTLVNEYRGGRLPLYHADLYRLDHERELDEIGLDDVVRRGDGLVLVEWADRYPVLPADSLRVAITIVGASARAIELHGGGPRSAALAAEVAARLTDR